jgi:hypothetical protein
MSQRIFENQARMPSEGGVQQRQMEAPLFSESQYAPSPLTVHSIMTPADARAVQMSEYPRNTWNDVVHVKSTGEES